MWQFWIDTGGTFTDCLARTPEGEERRVKVLSNAAIRGRVVEVLGRRRLRVELGLSVKDDFFDGYGFQLHGSESENIRITGGVSSTGVVDLDTDVSSIEAGALCSIQSPEEPPTLAMRLLTEKCLDEKLPPLELKLATTRGTNALLEGKGAKVAFFVTKGFGDLLRIGNQQRPDLFELGIRKRDPLHSLVCEVGGRLDSDGQVLEALDEKSVRSFAKQCIEEGIEAVAVALLHSYSNPKHEKRLGAILRESGIERVSLSCDLSPMIKILPRAETAVVDAYLAPIMEAYLDSVQAELPDRALKIMTSAGGLVSREKYRPKDSLLSGPAGGVVGASCVGKQAGHVRSIAFDMGGTSTDVSRFDGRMDYQFEQEIGGAHVFAPSLRIETVAAGGGSICWFDGSALRVGPASAGAFPGPACYGAGGPLTITDINLLLGRLNPSEFGIPVFPEKSAARFGELVEAVEQANGESIVETDVLLGLLGIANERMADAIRGISLREGYSPSEYALVAFGGAGGMHACEIANILEMDTIVFPSNAGLLSTYGLQQARAEGFKERQVLSLFEECHGSLKDWEASLVNEATEALVEEGEDGDDLEVQTSQVEMRFLGQESGLLIDLRVIEDLEVDFKNAFESQYGFIPDQTIEIVSLKVSVVARELDAREERFHPHRDLWHNSGKYCSRDQLSVAVQVKGPLVVQDRYSTVFIDQGWRALVGDLGTLKLFRDDESVDGKTQTRLEAVELELHTNRFLSVVEEMGDLLERSAFSTNVKERKDYSCALLDADGYLIANAPHIPVHLGALGVCIRTLIETIDLGSGDVAITNHPGYGGSHLPDVTLVAPVYSDNGRRVGYVANRAHHAELGGISPGSMPPNAKSLQEEGVVILPAYLVRKNEVDWPGITEVLTGGPYPTRRLEENLADLAAQLASIRFGEREVGELVRREGVDTISHFMNGLKHRAESALRTALENHSFPEESVVECLDNGAEIAVSISKPGPKWLVDFSGSAAMQASNYNATPAIVTSATIYALRLLANESIPLNEGFLDAVDIRIPEGMLNPHFDSDPARCPPVVAGNVEISQRIVDALLRALSLAACSQGTMNNLIFGNERVSYYETIAGGEGATRDRSGASAVHTHMTNTAITDPEILERRFPVRLECFEIRGSSGGRGINSGGNGVRRRIRFLEPVIISMLMQHREIAPFGMAGGEPGKVGRQWKIDREGNRIPLSGNLSLSLDAGEAIEIETPGGGGFGVDETVE